MSNIESLKRFGLNEREQTAYLALLELESASANRLAQKTGIKRPSMYDILYRLQSGGFVAEVEMHGAKVFLATPPPKLQEMLDEQRRQLERDLPQLMAAYNTKPLKPKVSYHYGFPGIKQLYEDTLVSVPAGGEILAFVTKDTIGYMREYSEDYVQRRVKKGISLRGIYQDSREINTYLEHDPEQLRVSRSVSEKEFPLKNEINIYADKVITITYAPEPFGIMVESKAVADTQRSIFEMAWRGISIDKSKVLL